MNPSWLERYAALKFQLVFYPTKSKAPEGLEAKTWPSKQYDATNYIEGQNIGVKLGTELEPGKFLADIDFDWPEFMPMAKDIFPPTDFGFGRASRTISHAFYTSPDPLVSVKYTNPDNTKTYVELRGTKKDGTIGLQTMLPPSVHPSGETVELRRSGQLGHSSELPRRTLLYGVSCLFFDFLGTRGLLHDTRLALAGYLLQHGFSTDEVILIGEAITRLSGNDAGDVATAVRSTAQRLERGEKVVGKSALVEALGDQGKKVLAHLRRWLGEEEFLVDKNDKPLPNQENIRRALDKMGVELQFDEFSQNPLIKYNGYAGVLNDMWVKKVWFRIEEDYKFRPAKEYFIDFVEVLGMGNTINPVKQYLTSLKWDGVPRINKWLTTYGKAADNPYTNAVGAIFMVAAVRRIMKPGCKFDELMVLESDQGTRKSSTLRALCPHEDWFSDDLPLNVDAKEIIERTRGKWIIEAAELSGMRASQSEHLKAMLSRQIDGPVRMAYARLAVQQPRQFVIAGTTNSHQYLTDITGNRRFWPVRVERFDVDGVLRDRDQLWAEAVVREAGGDTIHLDPKLWEVASKQQERRRSEDPWEPILESAYPIDALVPLRLTPNEVWMTLGIPVTQRDARSNGRVLAIMQQLGFRRLAVRDKDHGGAVVKGFARDPKVQGQGSLLEEEVGGV